MAVADRGVGAGIAGIVRAAESRSKDACGATRGTRP